MTRHDLDLFSLFSGLVLSGIALAALFDVSADVGPWVWPGVLIAVGVVVLVSVLSSTSDDDDAPEDAVLADARAEVEGVDHTTD